MVNCLWSSYSYIKFWTVSLKDFRSKMKFKYIRAI